MRFKEFITEFKNRVNRDGITIEYEFHKAYPTSKDKRLWVKALDAGGREMGSVNFRNIGNEWEGDDLYVDDRFRGQGIATVMYDFAKETLGRIVPSNAQTDSGKSFWQGKEVWEAKLDELNYPDELNVSDALQQHFVRRGYQVAGEGRDQIAFESPRGTVVKVLGIGDTEREDIVKRYVNFFVQHQDNPYYPKIYNTGEFPVGDETYFVYEQEYLNYVSDEEEVLEYIEDLMSALPKGEQALQAFYQNKSRPESLSPEEVAGLVQATYDLERSIGGLAPLDLSMIENIRRRNNGHLVIMDPYSL
jgi:GNAT superfamily N-acetyltransferase